MPEPFSLPWPNPDLDIHPEPPEGWHRVAVCSLWSSVKEARAWWPHAAVVGPLRTMRGIDLLVRSLLANRQVRVLVVGGKDIVQGEPVCRALAVLWACHDGLVGEDVTEEHLDALLDGVRLVLKPEIEWGKDWGLGATLGLDPPPVGSEDRPGDAIVLPPPIPVPTARAPHGDPGDRVAGDTLIDLWPRVLRRAMECGREAPTQYGPTREMLDLVSVIRDPKRTVNQVPINDDLTRLLHLTWEDLEGYYKRLVEAEVPDGAQYTYGSRLRGGFPVALAPGDEWHRDGRDGLWAYFECTACPPTRTCFDMDWSTEDTEGLRTGRLLLYCPRGHPIKWDDLRSTGPKTRSGYPPSPLATDQVEAVLGKGGLLAGEPGTRAAYLTPWQPEHDCGREEGRPCLVGAWFRRTSREGNAGELQGEVPLYVLHLTTVWRSHDLFGAWPYNLAACCLWLCRTAERHEMKVGTLTCLSMSAHIYEQDLAAAQGVIEGAP